MDTLFINSCVRAESRTLELCLEYFRKHDPGEMRELRLADMDIRSLTQTTLDMRNDAIAAGVQRDRYPMAAEFSEARHIVIGAPFWDCSFPAVLKAYIENICICGITVKYVDGKTVKLCRAESLTYITTSGGFIPEESSVERYMNELCDMLCIPSFRFIKAEGLDIVGADVEAILARAKAEL